MLLYVLLSSVLVGLISFIGVFFLTIKKHVLERILFGLIAFAAGTMLGNAFFHILPESVVELDPLTFSVLLMSGFSAFFVIEKVLHWRHCHHPGHQHPFGYLNLIGDGAHNFIDGLFIGASYVVSPALGVASTIAVIAHEIPQEIGDFAVLIHAGFSRGKALLLNFFSALLAVAGALVGWYFLNDAEAGHLVLPLVAGSLIYVASTDLIPELHKETNLAKSIIAFVLFLAGLALFYFLTQISFFMH